MFSNCSILHIEDDENDSILFRQALTNNGFAGIYHHVTSATDAMSRLANADAVPDLLVTDCQLPTDASEDFIRWARANSATAHLPIVVFSGTINPSLQRDVFERGATAFFSKSGNLDRIIAAVRQLLDGRCQSRPV